MRCSYSFRFSSFSVRCLKLLKVLRKDRDPRVDHVVFLLRLREVLALLRRRSRFEFLVVGYYLHNRRARQRSTRRPTTTRTGPRPSFSPEQRGSAREPLTASSSVSREGGEGRSRRSSRDAREALLPKKKILVRDDLRLHDGGRCRTVAFSPGGRAASHERSGGRRGGVRGREVFSIESLRPPSSSSSRLPSTTPHRFALRGYARPASGRLAQLRRSRRRAARGGGFERSHRIRGEQLSSIHRTG